METSVWCLQVRIVRHAFDIINLLTDINPIQVLVDAIINRSADLGCVFAFDILPHFLVRKRQKWMHACQAHTGLESWSGFPRGGSNFCDNYDSCH